MRKMIVTLLMSVLICNFLYSQCDPNPAYTRPGIYPDSASGFPPAVATYPYNLVITAVIPKDTLFFPFGRLNIDSIGVHEVSGLPEGFQALPNRPSGYWLGNTSGCMLITGTPSKNQVGEYPLKFTVVGYMGGFGLPIPYEITFYKITVLDSIFFGVNDPVKACLALKAYPNPFNERFAIDFWVAEPAKYIIEVYDTGTRKLVNHTIEAVPGKNSFTFDGNFLPRGIYFCMIRNEQNSIIEALKLLKQ